ncbi:hypothetical protein [Mesorhizobium sp. M0976]
MSETTTVAVNNPAPGNKLVLIELSTWSMSELFGAVSVRWVI